MCIKTPLQQKIIDRTNDGDQIAAFLVDTMNGQTPGVKVCHRMDAAKQLTKYGFPNEQATILIVIPAQAGIQRSRAATKPPLKVPSPQGRRLG